MKGKRVCSFHGGRAGAPAGKRTGRLVRRRSAVHWSEAFWCGQHQARSLGQAASRDLEPHCTTLATSLQA